VVRRALVLDLDELERRWQAGAPTDDGTIHVFVVRKGNGVHELTARIALTPEAGLEGDRWSTSAPRHAEAQLSCIERRVAALLAGDDPARWHVPGDNLVVDLDLSVAALPCGARLRIGSALVEITAKPHAGCDKFRARLGDDALRWVNARERRERRLRGVYARVLEAGVAAVGDRVVRVRAPGD
jgi:MOSC domain-containing protein YiiM